MKVGIIGVGVMGGSLLMNLKKNLRDCQVFAVSRGKEGQKWALDQGAEGATSDIQELPHDLDFLFLTSPSHVLEEQARELKEWPGKPLISDMASSKGYIVPRLDKILGSRYLSCHPMCGSEKTGLDGARSDLYNGKAVILTPGSSATQETLEQLTDFWSRLECRISLKTPEEHDQAVAWVSHMPHLVVPAILQAIGKAEDDEGSIFGVAGTGLRDVSRLAGSNPQLWKDIFLENQTAVRQAVASMQEELQICIDILDQKGDAFAGAMTEYLEKARELRSKVGLDNL